MRRRPDVRLFGALALAAGLEACATWPATSGGVELNPTVERGRDLARRECAQCHAIGPADESRRPSAPPLRRIRIRYNAISFERRMRAIAEEGHYEMPPLRLESSDVRDLAAYIETLDRDRRR